LGITLLSEKAELLKEQNKKTKDEIQSEEFRIKAVSDANKRIQDQIDSLTRRQTLWLKKHQEDIDNLQTAYNQLAELDIEKELFNHKLLSDYNTKTKQTIDLATLIKRCEQDENRYTKDINKLKNDITALENHTCHSCGQAFHNKKQEELLKEKKQALQTTALDALVNNTQLLENQNLLKQLGDPGEKPNTFYKNEIDAFEHRSSMASLLTQITNKQNEHDPYAEQIEEMKTSAVQEISYDTLNVLTNIKDHQEFLLKLLTNKDSFIRKKIIDQNLSYLNVRLAYYLDKIGLPHTVRFQNDLTVDIQELGRELDFDNLSRGERNRLILSLSWAFRDVWESLYNPINLLFIDELVDSGMDSSGVENSLAILKKMSRDGNRSVWLVSHKDELAGRVGNILTVVKENGFTSYNTDIQMV
jgi:DNA repair exonuclease SbcCD ATPase subunit